MRSTSMMAVLLASLGAAGTAAALPPHAAHGLRPGANHHTGDDGFVAHLGRAPGPGDEKLRMHEHFVAVRARLAALPATRPELQAKRDQLLAYLDAYIAKGTTPANDHLPWRTPVFIDDDHTICAVGYLIEQSAGRPLAETIAARHRYDFIEDIAKDMPEVRAWVEASGFTLDELGQIQPGYPGPEVLQWHTWEIAKNDDLKDGAYEEGELHGTIVHRKMEGAWRRQSAEGRLLGSGTFHRGAGSWMSYYDTGAKLAEGPYANNVPDGAWRVYHPSGNLAAEGRFRRGERSGHWKFYYDDATPTAIAEGGFAGGYVTGTWRHRDARGALLATSVVATPSGWHHDGQLFWSVGYLVDVAPTAAGVAHRIHQGSIDGEQLRLDELTSKDGQTRIYLRGTDEVYDDAGHKLVAVGGGWRADDCHWSRARKRAARAGDLTALHGLIYQATEEACAEGPAVPAARAAQVTKLVASMDEVRAATPTFLKELALGDDAPADLTNVIAASMSLDIEWPQVDGRFVQLYKTLPGLSR